MKPAGLAAVRAAQEDGRWDAAYEPQSSASVPADFQRALDRDPAARAFFETLTGREPLRVPVPDAATPSGRRPGRGGSSSYVAMLCEGRTLR